MPVLFSIPASTDADLLRRVWLFLQQHRLISGDELLIEVHCGVVTLRGRVATFHRRQRIVSAARRVAGVSDVVDELSVEAPQVGRAAPRTFSSAAGLLVTTVALFAVWLIVGCGRSGPPRVATNPAKGSITYQGQPIAGAFLALHPKAALAADVPTARAVVKPDGTFSVSTYDTGDGLPEGDYIVTALWRKVVKSGGEFIPGPDLLPGKYSRPETSDVIIHVAAGNNDLPPIVLKR
jgi:hypothetical protein